MFSEIPPKRVDEAWKQEIDKERRQFHREQGSSAERQQPAEQPETATAFANFLLGLRLQALIALGHVPNPLTQQLEPQPEQAQYLIDTLAMLQEKTKGNLTREEQALFDEVLYELRMKFVELMQPPPPGAQHA